MAAPGCRACGWLDVRHAVRRPRRRPAFAAASVVVLGLGIAAATSVFTLVHGVVLQPLPYRGAGELVYVDHGARGLGFDRGLGITHGVYRYYGERARGASALALYGHGSLTLTGEGDPVRLEVVRATPSLGAVLRVPPLLGRWFTAAEGEPGGPAVAVLSHRLWRDRFGADAGVVGRAVTLDGTPYEVVGVMPAGFGFPEATTDLWLPRRLPPTGVGGWNQLAVARLAPGVASADFERELATLLPGLVDVTDEPARARGYIEDAGVFPRVVALKESVVGSIRARLWILLGAVGVVLLIAVSNVANLFLVRAEDGQRETTVRAALGARRSGQRAGPCPRPRCRR